MPRSAPSTSPLRPDRPEELAREHEPSAESIRRRAVQAQIDDGEREGLSAVERKEFQRLRRENDELKPGYDEVRFHDQTCPRNRGSSNPRFPHR